MCRKRESRKVRRMNRIKSIFKQKRIVRKRRRGNEYRHVEKKSSFFFRLWGRKIT
jgi:hypothetical protein